MKKLFREILEDRPVWLEWEHQRYEEKRIERAECKAFRNHRK